MRSFSQLDRQNNIKELKNEHFDLLIIGGGINGAGVARDAAMRGMKVAVIEASDFASGTSSRSSKLIHGGIRYLENLEFHLVFEALSERRKLFSMARHLVHPLRFMIPLYKGGRVGMTSMGIGMWLYDALSLFQAPELHEKLSAVESENRQPVLQSKDLLGSYVYSDAYMDDDRLVIETLRSAAKADAVICSYVKAKGYAEKSDGTISIAAEDTEGKQSFSISCDHVVSSVGPWTDELGKLLISDWKKRLRPTKGVHLTFSRDRVPLSSAVVMGAESRIVFAIPRHEMVIVGTTDTDYKGDPGQVSSDKEDVEYLLKVVDQYFPGANIKEEDIISTYSGVRPLMDDGAKVEGKTSREHTIWTDPRRITFVAGGKYTTFRLMSKQVVDEVLGYFDIEKKSRWLRCQTEQPLNPLVTDDTLFEEQSQKAQIASQHRFPEESLNRLFERHGLEAVKILNRWPNLQEVELEAMHAIHETQCGHLVDFFTRRMPLMLSHKDHGLEFMPQVSKIFAQELNWSPEQQRQEVLSYENHIKKELEWRSSPG